MLLTMKRLFGVIKEVQCQVVHPRAQIMLGLESQRASRRALPAGLRRGAELVVEFELPKVAALGLEFEHPREAGLVQGRAPRKAAVQTLVSAPLKVAAREQGRASPNRFMSRSMSTAGAWQKGAGQARDLGLALAAECLNLSISKSMFSANAHQRGQALAVERACLMGAQAPVLEAGCPMEAPVLAREAGCQTGAQAPALEAGCQTGAQAPALEAACPMGAQAPGREVGCPTADPARAPDSAYQMAEAALEQEFGLLRGRARAARLNRY
jgi:hypothetical protein